MQKYNFIALILVTLSLGACDKLNNSAPKVAISEHSPEKGEKVVKNFDVDHMASDNFKAEMKAKFAPDSTTDIVESGLKSKGFECRVDPSNKNERGCDKMETKDTCIYMSVVKTLPFNPEGAQVIKVCDVNQ